MPSLRIERHRRVHMSGHLMNNLNVRLCTDRKRRSGAAQVMRSHSRQDRRRRCRLIQPRREFCYRRVTVEPTKAKQTPAFQGNRGGSMAVTVGFEPESQPSDHLAPPRTVVISMVLSYADHGKITRMCTSCSQNVPAQTGTYSSLSNGSSTALTPCSAQMKAILGPWVSVANGSDEHSKPHCEQSR